MRKTLLIAVVLTFVASSVFAAGMLQDFNAFSNGNLSGQGNWTRGDGGTSWIQVVDGMVKIVGGDTGGGDRKVGNSADYAGYTGTIFVEFDILGAEWGNTSWSVLADAGDDTATSGNLARAYGAAGSVRGRIGDQGIVTGQDALAAGWNHIKIVIDTAANTDTFYMNGTLLTGTNPISHAGFAGDVLSRIAFHKVQNGQDVYLDNLWVGDTEMPAVPEPASMLALLSGLVGIVGFARRRK